MGRFLDYISGRIDPVEDNQPCTIEKCAWKRVAEREVQLEGSLQQCNSCDGYKTSCDNYYVTGAGRRKLRE